MLFCVLAATASAGLVASGSPKKSVRFNFPEADKPQSSTNSGFLAARLLEQRQQAQADEILGVAAIVIASQKAAQLAYSASVASAQAPIVKKCIAMSSPSMAFICTCPKHKLSYSSYKK